MLNDRVIPIPDYKFFYSRYDNEDKTDDCDELYGRIRRDGEADWIDGRAFWCGNILNSYARYNLMILAEQFPNKVGVIPYFETEDGFVHGKENFVSMHDFMRYRYLIDVRGWGWTDRVKLLLAMGRPLLLVDRPFREFYFDDLKPMVHFVPVKEDLSDMIEKIEYLDDNPDVVSSIVNNAREFTKEHFSKDAIINSLYRALEN